MLLGESLSRRNETVSKTACVEAGVSEYEKAAAESWENPGCGTTSFQERIKGAIGANLRF